MNFKRWKPLPAACDSGHDRNRLTRRYRSVKTVEVTDIVISNEHIDELVEITLFVQDLAGKPRVRGFESLENGAQRPAFNTDRACTPREWTQCGGDPNGDGHSVRLSLAPSQDQIGSDSSADRNEWKSTARVGRSPDEIQAAIRSTW